MGLDTSLAEALMHNMMATLCMMVRHRLSIRRSLAQAQASGRSAHRAAHRMRCVQPDPPVRPPPREISFLQPELHESQQRVVKACEAEAEGSDPLLALPTPLPARGGESRLRPDVGAMAPTCHCGRAPAVTVRLR
jgi:hypothetical protein